MKKNFSTMSSIGISNNSKQSNRSSTSSYSFIFNQRYILVIALVVLIGFFTTGCSGYDLQTEVSYRFRNIFGRFLKKGLILDRNPDPGNVGGIYRDEQGQEISFFVWRDSLATINFYEKGEILPKLLQIDWDDDEEKIDLRYQYISEDGWSSVYTNVDGMGVLTREEQVAMDDLFNHSMMKSLAMIPLDIACQEDVKISEEQMAMLVYPLQMLFKYNVAQRSAFAAELASLSECDYGGDQESADQEINRILMMPSSPVPVVFGYFPFDPEGAKEASATTSEDIKLASLDNLFGVIGITNPKNFTLPGIVPVADDIIRDEWGPCKAKCRGACGSDCTTSNCKLTVEDRCEKNQDGENDGFKSIVYSYDCGLHPGCIKHDACYDTCNSTYGCDTFAASFCMHGTLIVSTPIEYLTESYISCDSEVVLEDGLFDSLAWMGGGGPQTSRQVYEYTDPDYGYDYDPVSCPLDGESDVDDSSNETQEEASDLEESDQADEEPQEEPIEEIEENDDQSSLPDSDNEEDPTEENPEQESEPEEFVDPCDLLPINGVVMDQAAGYCRGEYNVDPYISVSISLLDRDLSTEEACQSLGQDGTTQVLGAVDFGDCGVTRLISYTMDKPTMDYHAGWDIVYISNRFMVDVYTLDWYATNKIWLEELALSVERNIQNIVK